MGRQLEAEISKIPWKRIIQSMTGHKSNSNLEPFIHLREIFSLFLSKEMKGKVEIVGLTVWSAGCPFVCVGRQGKGREE